LTAIGSGHPRRGARRWLAVLSGTKLPAAHDSDGEYALLLRRAVLHRARALDARVPAATEALFQQVLAGAAAPWPAQPQQHRPWLQALRRTLAPRAGAALALALTLVLPSPDRRLQDPGLGDSHGAVRGASGTLVLVAPDPMDRLRQIREVLAGTGAILRVQAGDGGLLCVWLPASTPVLDALASIRLEPATEAGRVALMIVPAGRSAPPAASANSVHSDSSAPMNHAADANLSASCPSE
jgi:hypothetical protein